MPETLNGFIERVTYHNPENGSALLRVKVEGRDNLVSVVGSTTVSARSSQIRLLAQAIQSEVAEWIDQHRHVRNEQGRCQAVRNG